MPPRVSTGDRDAVLRQIRWCAAVQTLVNCHCQLEESPVGNVKPMQLVVQYLTQAAINMYRIKVHVYYVFGLLVRVCVRGCIRKCVRVQAISDRLVVYFYIVCAIT